MPLITAGAKKFQNSSSLLGAFEKYSSMIGNLIAPTLLTFLGGEDQNQEKSRDVLYSPPLIIMLVSGSTCNRNSS